MVRRALVSAWAVLLLAACALPAASQFTGMVANDARAQSMRDALRAMKAALAEPRLANEISAAFRGCEDWGRATEAYYARRTDLAARASALEAKLVSAVTAGSEEDDAAIKERLDAVQKQGALLSQNYQMYVRLPRLAATSERAAAQASMRLLSQTGDYPVTAAFFHEKTPGRPPFTGLPPQLLPRAR